MNQGFVHGANPVIPITNEESTHGLEQTQRRGRRLSIIGFFQPLISFIYGLVIGGVSRKSYIQMMEQEAESAEKAGQISVIVQDNGSIHRCKEAQKLWSKWEHMGLYIFFLPAYCSEMLLASRRVPN